MSVSTVRARDVIVLIERLTDTRGDSLLSDVKMEESGEFAISESVLHLRFEFPDASHCSQHLNSIL
jgi:hypothetical protein